MYSPNAAEGGPRSTCCALPKEWGVGGSVGRLIPALVPVPVWQGLKAAGQKGPFTGEVILAGWVDSMPVWLWLLCTLWHELWQECRGMLIMGGSRGQVGPTLGAIVGHKRLSLSVSLGGSCRRAVGTPGRKIGFVCSDSPVGTRQNCLERRKSSKRGRGKNFTC